LELGGEYAELATRGRMLSGRFGKGQPGSFEYPGELAPDHLAVALGQMRIAVAFLPWLYGGFGMAIRGGDNELPSVQTSDGYRVFRSPDGVNSWGFSGGGVAGLRAPLGYASVRVETLLGGRVISVSQAAMSRDYPASRNASVSLATWLVEPRVHLDL